MYKKPTTQTTAVTVNKYIGSAYDDLQIIIDNLDKLLEVAGSLYITFKYTGAHTTPPTVRLDGNPLQNGDYYFRTEDGREGMYYYDLAEVTWFLIDPAAILAYAQRAELAAGNAEASEIEAAVQAGIAKTQADRAQTIVDSIAGLENQIVTNKADIETINTTNVGGSTTGGISAGSTIANGDVLLDIDLARVVNSSVVNNDDLLLLQEVDGTLKTVQKNELITAQTAYQIRGSVQLDSNAGTGTVNDFEYGLLPVSTNTPPVLADPSKLVDGVSYIVSNTSVVLNNSITGTSREFFAGATIVWVAPNWVSSAQGVQTFVGRNGNVVGKENDYYAAQIATTGPLSAFDNVQDDLDNHAVRIRDNEATLAINTPAIIQNRADIDSNDIELANHEARITQNRTDINSNDDEILANTNDIVSLKADTRKAGVNGGLKNTGDGTRTTEFVVDIENTQLAATAIDDDLLLIQTPSGTVKSIKKVDLIFIPPDTVNRGVCTLTEGGNGGTGTDDVEGAFVFASGVAPFVGAPDGSSYVLSNTVISNTVTGTARSHSAGTNLIWVGGAWVTNESGVASFNRRVGIVDPEIGDYNTWFPGKDEAATISGKWLFTRAPNFPDANSAQHAITKIQWDTKNVLLDTALSDEVADRIAADAVVQGNVNIEKGRIDALVATVDTPVTGNTARITANKTEIDTHTNTLATHRGELDTLNTDKVTAAADGGLANTGDGTHSTALSIDISNTTRTTAPIGADTMLIDTAGGLRSVTVDNLLANVSGGIQLRGRADARVGDTVTVLVTGDASNPTITQGTAPNAGGGSADGFTYIVSLLDADKATGVVITFGGLLGANEPFTVFDQDQLTWIGSQWYHLETGDAVLSVFGRNGAITAQSDDYHANQITSNAGKVQSDLDAINNREVNYTSKIVEETVVMPWHFNTIDISDIFVAPQGTVGSGAAGQFRFNPDLGDYGEFEGRNKNSEWTPIGGGSDPAISTQVNTSAVAGNTPTILITYSVGYVDVFVNGAKLAPADFTATNGTSVVFNQALVVDSNINVVGWNHVPVVSVNAALVNSTTGNVQSDIDSLQTLTTSLKGRLDDFKYDGGVYL